MGAGAGCVVDGAGAGAVLGAGAGAGLSAGATGVGGAAGFVVVGAGGFFAAGSGFLLQPLNVNATKTSAANAVRTTFLMVTPFRKTISLNTPPELKRAKTLDALADCHRRFRKATCTKHSITAKAKKIKIKFPENAANEYAANRAKVARHALAVAVTTAQAGRS